MKKFKTTMIVVYSIIILSLICIVAFKPFQKSERVKVDNRNNSGVIVTDERLFDNADILTDEEESTLKKYMEKVSEEKKTDIIIVTTNDAEGMGPKEYAENFYDTHDFGYEDCYGTGLLYLINLDTSVTGSREIWITTTKDAMDYFNEKRIDKSLDSIINVLTKDEFNLNYYGSCNEFIGSVEKYMNVPTFTLPWYIQIGISLVVAIIIVSILIYNSKGKKTITSTTYLKRESYSKNLVRDTFMYKNVTSRKIEKSSSSGGGSSRSGGSHGGGGRSF